MAWSNIKALFFCKKYLIRGYIMKFFTINVNRVAFVCGMCCHDRDAKTVINLKIKSVGEFHRDNL